MKLSWLNIPQELKSLKQWAVATLTLDADGTPDKSPRDPRTGDRISTVDPLVWSTFEECANAGYPAIGFMLAPSDPFAIIDLDYKPGMSEEIAQRQILIHSHFPSYSERSVSGKGLHIVIKGSLGGGVRRDLVEVYDRARFMLCTGDIVDNLPIKAHKERLDQLVYEMGGLRDELFLPPDEKERYSDDEIIARAANARNGEKFQDLFYRKPGAGEDWSQRDAALAQIICFYTRNHKQAMRIFRRSALYRPNTKGKNPHHYEDYYLLAKTFGRAWNLDSMRQEDEKANLQIGQQMAEQLMKKKARPQTGVAFPAGLVGEVADYILKASQRPVPEIALAGALAFCAGLFGRQYNVNRTGLNLYIVLVAKTGRGKEGVASGIDALTQQLRQTIPVVDEFRGPARIASGQALLRSLADKPCMFSILGEFGHTLQTITSDRASSAEIAIRQVLLDLFAKSGQHQVLQAMIYSDKDKNTDPIQAPAYTFLGDTTPEAFYAAINSYTVAEGLVPRFLTITYNGPRVPTNRSPIWRAEQGLLDRLSAAILGVLNARQSNRYIDVDPTPEAQKMLDQYDEYCDAQINRVGSGTDSEVWNRAHLKLLRLAAIVAVGVNPAAPRIEAEHVIWARTLLDREMHTALNEIETNTGAHSNKQLAALRQIAEDFMSAEPESLLNKYNIPKKAVEHKVIPKVYFRRRAGGQSLFSQDRRGFGRALDEGLKEAVEDGLLQEVSREQKIAFGGLRAGTPYYVLGTGRPD